MKKIKILHIVDSFAIGGKEKMAISIANVVNANKDYNSYVCATTSSGPLIKEIDSSIEILLLNKTSFLDIQAIQKIISFVKNKNISIIHAHSSSFFTAVICSLFTDIKIVWHDHNGNRDKMSFISKSVLKLFSVRFDYVLTVSDILENWAKNNLYINDNKIKYLPNFVNIEKLSNVKVDLPGTCKTRIVCVANLRYPKNHMLLLESFKELHKKKSDWHLLLVGTDFNDNYSNNLKMYIKNNKLENNIHILGSQSNIGSILDNSTIGVLSSESEGLPISLLEYGTYKLPVVCTDVGYCKQVLKDGSLGLVVESNNKQEYTEKLFLLTSEEKLQHSLGNLFFHHIKEIYSDKVVVNKIIDIYKEVAQ